MSELNGSWMDEMGACRVCDGEIPHGHTKDCDIYKMDQEQNKLQQQLTATQQKIERLKALVEEAGPYKALSLDWDKFTKILWEPVSPNVPQ